MPAADQVANERPTRHTDTDVKKKTGTGAQICDGRYASSYKLAHCGLIPTSPPENVSEFPPQRQKPCHDLGNFVVGGGGSRESRIAPVRSRAIRGALNWTDKGSVYHRGSSRYVDSFVHSLRKYPQLAPSSSSAKLINKIYQYTQAKNSEEDQKPSKDQTTECNELPKNYKQSKHIQTYTRARHRESSNSRTQYRKKGKKEKVFGSRSYGGNRLLGFAYYDYLKVGSSRRFNKEERRKEEKIQRNCKEVYQVCPSVKRRYIEHKKACPSKKRSDAEQSCQASIPVLSRILAALSGYSSQVCSIGKPSLSPCCRCSKASDCRLEEFDSDESQNNTKICDCLPTAKASKQDSECICEEDRSKYRSDEENPCACTKINKKYFSERIDEIFEKWLKNIPVSANENEACKAKRRRMINNLAKVVKALPDDEHFIDNVFNEVHKSIDELPMWNPGSKLEQKRLKQNLAESLTADITDVPRTLNIFKEAIRKWVNDTKFTEPINEKEIVDYLFIVLKPLAKNRPTNDDEYKRILKNKLKYMLERLPIQKIKLESFVKKLTDKLVGLPKDINLPEDDIFTETIEYEIKDWLNDVVDVTGDIREDTKRRQIKSLAGKLKKFRSQHNLNNDEARDKITLEIEKVLEDLGVDSYKQDKSTNKLIRLMSDIYYQTNKKPIFKEVLDTSTISEGIQKLLPEISGDISHRKLQTLGDELADAIEKSREKGNEKNSKVIKELLKNQGLNGNLENSTRVVQSMSDMIHKSPMVDTFADEIKYDIIKKSTTIIDETPMPANEKTNVKNKLNTLISKHLDKLAASSDKENDKSNLLNEIAVAINAIIMNNESKEELKNKILEQTENDVDKLIKLTKDRTRNFETKVKRHIDDALKDIPIAPEQKNYIKNVIFDRINDARLQSVPEYIKEAMNAGISNLIDNLLISNNQKHALIAKIENVCYNILNEPYVQGDAKKLYKELTKNVSDILKNVVIPVDKERKLKYAVKNVVARNLTKPLISSVSKATSEVIQNSSVPDALKAQVSNQIKLKILGDIETLPTDKDEIDHLKSDILKGAMHEIDRSIPPGIKRDDLKTRLSEVLSKKFDYLYPPLTLDDINNLQDNVQIIIDTASLSPPEKEQLKPKIDQIFAKMKNYTDLRLKSEGIQNSSTSEKSTQDLNLLYGSDSFQFKFKIEDQETELQGTSKMFNESELMTADKKKIDNLKNDILEQLKKPMTEENIRDLLDSMAENIKNLSLTESQKNVLAIELTNVINENVVYGPSQNNIDTLSKDNVNDTVPEKLLMAFKAASNKSDFEKEKLYKYADMLPIPQHLKEKLKHLLNLPDEHREIIKQQKLSKLALRKREPFSMKKYIESALSGKDIISQVSTRDQGHTIDMGETKPAYNNETSPDKFVNLETAPKNIYIVEATLKNIKNLDMDQSKNKNLIAEKASDKITYKLPLDGRDKQLVDKLIKILEQLKEPMTKEKKLALSSGSANYVHNRNFRVSELSDMVDENINLLPIDGRNKQLVNYLKIDILERLQKPITKEEIRVLLDRLAIDIDTLSLAVSVKKSLVSELTNMINAKVAFATSRDRSHQQEEEGPRRSCIISKSSNIDIFSQNDIRNAVPKKLLDAINASSTKSDAEKEKLSRYADMLPIPQHQKDELKRMLHLPVQNRTMIKQRKVAFKKPEQVLMKEQIVTALKGQDKSGINTQGQTIDMSKTRPASNDETARNSALYSRNKQVVNKIINILEQLKEPMTKDKKLALLDRSVKDVDNLSLTESQRYFVSSELRYVIENINRGYEMESQGGNKKIDAFIHSIEDKNSVETVVKKLYSLANDPIKINNIETTLDKIQYLEAAKDLEKIINTLPIDARKKQVVNYLINDILEKLKRPMTTEDRRVLLDRLAKDVDNLSLAESQRNFLLSELTNMINENAVIASSQDKSYSQEKKLAQGSSTISKTSNIDIFSQVDISKTVPKELLDAIKATSAKSDSEIEKLNKYTDMLPLTEHQKEKLRRLLNLPKEDIEIIKHQKMALKKPGEESIKEQIVTALSGKDTPKVKSQIRIRDQTQNIDIGPDPSQKSLSNDESKKEVTYKASQTNELKITCQSNEELERALLQCVDLLLNGSHVPPNEKDILKNKFGSALRFDLSTISDDKFNPTVNSTPLQKDSKNPSTKATETSNPSSSKSKWSTFSDQDLTSASTSRTARRTIDRRRSVPERILSTIIDEDGSESDTDNANTAQTIKKYIYDLKKEIHKWLDGLSVDFAPEDKNDIIDEMVSDIVRKEKNIQMHPEIKTTAEEKKNKYKKQIFRRLNRILDAEELLPALFKAQQLVDKLKKVEVPKLVSKTGPYDDIINKELDGASKTNRHKKQKVRQLSQVKQIIKEPLSNSIEYVLNISALPIQGTEKNALKHDLEGTLERLADSQTDVAGTQINITKKFVDTGYPEHKAPDLANILVKRAVIEVKTGKDKLHEMEKNKGKVNKALMAQDIANVLKQSSLTEFEKTGLLDLIDLLHSSDSDSSDEETEVRKEAARSVGEDRSRNETEPVDIRNMLDDFIFSLPIVIKSPEDKTLFEEVKQELQSLLQGAGLNTDFNTLREKAKLLIQRFPLHPDALQSETYLNEKADELTKNLQQEFKKHAEKAGDTKPHEGLYDFIDDELANLEFTNGMPEDENKKIITERAARLRNKIVKLNLDSQIFNDDFLYDDVIDDEIENMLADLPVTDKSAKSLKGILKKKSLEAKHKITEGLKAQMYKQQLRDVISTTLPEKCNASSEEKVIYEILKDELADAFINLHYSGGNEGLRTRLKSKINDKIHKFCFDYIKTCSTMPIDINRVNNELYAALISVPVPKDETMTPEVNQARMRNEICDWMEKLPLKPLTPSENLNAHKMVYILSKKLNEIEENEANMERKDQEMRQEVTKRLKKMPLKPSQEIYTNKFVDDLIDILKDTEESRRFENSKRYSVADDKDCIGSVCKSQLYDKRQEPCMTSIPPSTLSFKDRCLLESIRARAAVNEGSQTDVQFTAPIASRQISNSNVCSKLCSESKIMSHDCFKRRPTVSSGPPPCGTMPCGVPTCRPPMFVPPPVRSVPCGPMLGSNPCLQSSREEVQPHVVVKEYLWESPTTSSERPPRPHPGSRHTCSHCSRKKAPQYPRKSPILLPNAPRSRDPSPCAHSTPMTSHRSAYNTSNPNISKRNRLEDYQDSCSSKSSGNCVIELGSLSDLGPRMSNRQHHERRTDENRPFRKCIFNQGLPNPDKKRRPPCKCSTCTRKYQKRQNDSSHTCQNCSGAVHCPYPSFFYFRR